MMTLSAFLIYTLLLLQSRFIGRSQRQSSFRRKYLGNMGASRYQVYRSNLIECPEIRTDSHLTIFFIRSNYHG